MIPLLMLHNLITSYLHASLTNLIAKQELMDLIFAFQVKELNWQIHLLIMQLELKLLQLIYFLFFLQYINKLLTKSMLKITKIHINYLSGK